MNKFLKVIVPLLLAVLIIASIGWYLFSYDREFTQDMLLKQARYNDTVGNAKLSSFFYDLAYRFSGHDQNVAIELANQYKADGNFTKAEYTLVNAISDAATPELYAALCNTYVEQNKILDAVTMLDSIADPAIKAKLDAQRPAAPAADYEDGFYSEYISITLSSGNGTIYYTTSGDYPSMDSIIYEEPVALTVGETVIKSICVGENGLVSRLSSATYTIGGIVELVEFADPAVELVIRDMLNTGTHTDIYTNELWDIEEFTFPEDAVAYTDLSYLPNLKKLTFTNLTLDSLSYLKGLTLLESLSFTGCRFPAEELDVLGSLTNLQRLTMDGCGLSTIAKLSDVRTLTYLNINNNTIRNLEALSAMTSLQELHMNHNALTSLSALGALTNLAVLDVSYNSLPSILPISGCVRLQTLNVTGNLLTDLNGINSLICLAKFHADFNQLTDVTLLGECTGLVELSVSNNAITDISALSTLTALESFNFSYNQVEALPEWTEGAIRTINGAYNLLENIDILANQPQLSYVYMDYNQITSVDALADCYYLVQVNVYGNPVSDVSALTDHSIIVNYDPTA